MARATERDVLEAVERVNEALRSVGSSRRFRAAGRYGYTGVDELRGGLPHGSPLMTGTKGEAVEYLTAMGQGIHAAVDYGPELPEVKAWLVVVEDGDGRRARHYVEARSETEAKRASRERVAAGLVRSPVTNESLDVNGLVFWAAMPGDWMDLDDPDWHTR